MLRKFLGFLVLLCGICSTALAQFYPTQYRPPNQNWQYLETQHFKLLYSQGNDSTALQMGQILEHHYGSIQDIVGGELQNFPVILNDYNDRSNGFVTSLHFRSEIELPPIKGKSQNPQTGSWYHNVGPHELVHALQFSNLGDHNIPQFISLFSPDMARSFHGAIPQGIVEGIAVDYETDGVAPNGGRGNYPVFTNYFDATFQSNQRWSMGQNVHFSTDTRPFNRHYAGGYEFTSWMQDKYGSGTTRKAIDFYMDFPFLGYGVALKHATGLWPGQLYNRFEDHQEKNLQGKTASGQQISELEIPYDGRDIRRPKWLSDSTLVFYGSFYNARAGFYRYNLSRESMKRILTTNSVQDYRYDLSEDRREMIFSYYETSPIYDRTSKAELVRYHFETKNKQQITSNGRLYAPEFSEDQLLALQTRPNASALTKLDLKADGKTEISSSFTLDGYEIVAVSENPETNQIAIVADKKGLQGLWITGQNDIKEELKEHPDISFENGSVFDPEWHPGGKKLLFSSDFSGTFQLYEFDLKEEQIQQVTDAAYNAFEGSYSPSGNRVAFVRQVINERLPAIIKREHFVSKPIPTSVWQQESSTFTQNTTPTVSDSIVSASQDWEIGSYSTGFGWIKPRTIAPVFEEVSNRDVYQVGLALHSNSLLADQTYSAEFSYHESRTWYDITYQNKSFYPGFKARLFSQPSYISVPLQNNQLYTFLRQERALALSVPLEYQFNQNVFSTSLFLEPEFRQSQIRIHDIATTVAKSNFADISIANIFGQFNYRLQQNIRDLQPNSGLILYGELEHYLSAGNADLTVADQNFRFSFRTPTALRGGLFTYVSPLRKWNQSLRVGIEGVTQTNIIFDNQSVVSDGFSERILPGSNNLLSLSTRYTIPLFYVDDGGFLLPLYLSNIYLVGFTDTVADPTLPNWQQQSRSVFGLGIRARFRISNLSFNIGVGFGYEPTRNNTQFFIGEF